MTMIDAVYYDGLSTRRQPVTMVLHKRVAAIRGDGLRQNFRLSKLLISERLERAPRIIYLPGGACLHVSDPGLDAMLAANGYRDGRVVQWQQNWHLSLAALVSLLAILIAGYQWGLPWAADRIARHLPASLEKRVGDEQLKLIDEQFMAPSKLIAADQERLRQRFAAMKQPRGEQTAYRLEFRHSKIGPNAFALPNGVILMTDQLVMLARNDEAVLGVLAHELGHLQRRHSLRRLLQAIGVGVVVNLWIGDVSAILATVPTLLLDQKYSRDFEREADQYAIDMMRANRLPLTPMAQLFEKMGRVDSHRHDENEDGRPKKQRAGGEEESLLEYFSSHPSDVERIGKLRNADRH